MKSLNINNAIVQQDNTATRTSKLTKDWAKNKEYWSFELAH